MPPLLRGLATRLRRAIKAFEGEPVPPFTAPEGLFKFTVILTKDRLDGGYIAEVPEIPGCLSQGDTTDEAFENILEAVAEILGVRLERQKPPIPTRDGDSLKVAVAV